MIPGTRQETIMIELKKAACLCVWKLRKRSSGAGAGPNLYVTGQLDVRREGGDGFEWAMGVW